MRRGELRRHCEVAKDDFITGYELPCAPYRLRSRGRGTNISEYRAMGTLSGAAVCLLPGVARPDNSIALIRGGKASFVHRRQWVNWKLIGEHGIVEGKAWEGDRGGEIS